MSMQPKPALQRQMYELTGPSRAQRFVLALLLGAWVALAWWLLLGGGIGFVDEGIGIGREVGDAARRLALAAAFSIYFIRVLFTEFVFLKRGISWAEVFTIAPWILCIDVWFAFAGGTNVAAFGMSAIIGAICFVLGSWMNSYSEYQRHEWKQKLENRGKLYTQGLFRYSRHPNYLGDLIAFSGLCLFTGRWFTAAVPALMLCGFVFVNIPVQDAHLHDHYGASFDSYAQRTRKLIPLLY